MDNQKMTAEEAAKNSEYIKDVENFANFMRDKYGAKTPKETTNKAVLVFAFENIENQGILNFSFKGGANKWLHRGLIELFSDDQVQDIKELVKNSLIQAEMNQNPFAEMMKNIFSKSDEELGDICPCPVCTEKREAKSKDKNVS